jgi:hypothetical protein
VPKTYPFRGRSHTLLERKLDRLAAPAVSSGDAIWLKPSRRVSALGGLARTEARLTHSLQALVEPGQCG